MWTRRDYGMLAAAAIATFGLAVGTFWPRLANAVDDKPAATTEVKIPTLTLGNVQITAAIARESAHAVVLTVKNTSDQNAPASFKAYAQVTPPSNPFSREVSLPRPAWTSDYTLNLKPGEAKAIHVQLPADVFNVPPTPALDEKVSELLRTVPGRSDLRLVDSGNTANAVMALELISAPKPKAAPAVAAANKKPGTP